MTNNDIIRQLRYIFDFSDEQMIAIFSAADHSVTRDQVIQWLNNNEEEQLFFMNSELNLFLDGLINEKRGKRPDYKKTIDKELTNNNILRKLKIALNLKDFEMIKIFKLADVNIGKHELSAFFRNPKQRQYRDMGNQYLRNFLHGLQLQLRPTPNA